MSTKVYKFFIYIIIILFFAALYRGYVWYKMQFADYESGPIADVYLEIGNSPMNISCRVVDIKGKPLSSVVVDFRNNSGGNPGITNEAGLVQIAVGEKDLEQILVNNIVIMNRPYSYELGYPSVERGLQVKIVIKDLKAVTQQD